MKRNSKVKMIQGIPADDFFGEVIGPMAAAVMQKMIYKYLQDDGKNMTGAEIRMVQFAVEKSFGTPTRHVEVANVSEQEINANDLAGLDLPTLERIAAMNAKRDDDHTVN